jgi:hypothetical protein
MQHAALVELARQGIVTLPVGRLADLRPVRPKRGTLVSNMVIEDRR